MSPGVALLLVGVLVLGGTLLARVFAEQAGAVNRLSRFFMLFAVVVGVFAVLAGVLDLVTG